MENQLFQQRTDLSQLSQAIASIREAAAWAPAADS